ncbi:chitooligosaccharidolytic beta-N-acetylglucosaminidase-like [Melitaea cinxia]|uniref:chitooligosaccharidolytic beta-N-acetylglucosaminidase-like n=1 Tax=Melitaea cinxia TaxID=113334 RepID=UPI001E26EF71|nr:chitooligosaccharidolytic beta-N-acetylglucosaminidase-like [Melitaea cinxia]
MAYFNLTRIFFGAGILGLPLAVSQGGIILGPIMSVGLGLLIIHMHITLVLSIDKALKDPRVLTKSNGVIYVCMLTATIVLTVFGVLGYWSFGTMEENVLRSLPFDDNSAILAIGLYLMSIAFVYPIQCYPAIQIIIEVIKNRDTPFPPSEKTLKMVEFVARPLFVLTSFFVCYLVPIQGAFVAFVGNLCTTLLALVFPALMELCILYPNQYGKYNFYLIKDLIIVIFGASSWVIGQLPLWTWDCIDDKCISTKATKYGRLQSLVTCNMLCTSVQLWPKPTGTVSLSKTALPVRADLFYLKILSFPSIHVRKNFIDAFELFRQDLYKMENNVSVIEPHCPVEIRVAINESGNNDPRMLFDTDESYRLKLTANLSAGCLIAEIASNSFCGARHALETLSQLLWFDPYAGTLLILDTANIEDSPRFRYRGLMLDTVHNYFPVNEICKTIDVMAATKLNTLHWRAADSQGLSIHFRSLSQLPYYELYKQGAVYTPEEVHVIAKHARKRGIKVLIEVDLSSLASNAWNCGSNILGQLIRDDVECSREYNNEFLCREIYQNNSHLYDVIEKIYAEIIEITGIDDIFHLAGEDICEYCLQSLNRTDPIELKLQITRNILQLLESKNKKLPNLILLWSTHLSDRIKIDLKKYLHKLGVQVLNIQMKNYVTGLRTVISYQDAWDFNSGYGEWYMDTGGVNYNSWQRVYEYRPWSWRNMAYVIGGEATVWSSLLGAGGLQARVWPRLAALGERLWSDSAESATHLVQVRLDVHRSRLNDRGIKYAPIWSMWCTQNYC